MMSYGRESLGLFDGADYLTLSSGVRIAGTVLFDEVTGAHHRLREPAPILVQHLQSGVTLQEWLDICRLHNVGRPRAIGVLLSLNQIAGLYRKRSLTRIVPSTLRWLAIYRYGVVPQRLAKRYPGTYAGLLAAGSRATAPLAIVTFVACAALMLGGLPRGKSVGVMTFWLVVLIVSTMAHEWAHWTIARRHGSGCFVRRGLRLGVLHAPLPDKEERLSALLGPLTGLVVTTIFCGLLAAMKTPIDTIILLSSIAVFHLCSWLPIYGDGRTLLRARKVGHA